MRPASPLLDAARIYRGQAVIVTGGAGFIGSHLVERLVTLGARVTVIDNLSTGRLRNLAAVRGQLDLRELDLVTDDLGPLLHAATWHTVFHLAGNANVQHSVLEPREDLERNAIATFNLLTAVKESAPKTRVIHTSSAAVYGEGVTNPIREDDPKRPISPYGLSKLTSEHYVRLFAELYALSGCNVRLFSVYGPRLRKQVVWDLMRKLHANPHELHLYGDGSQVRDLNHVGNVIDALVLVVGRAALQGEDYNVAAGEHVSIRDLVAKLAGCFGVEPELVYSGQVRAGEIQAWYPDTSRIEALGYRTRVSLDQGLTETVAWFKQEPEGVEQGSLT